MTLATATDTQVVSATVRWYCPQRGRGYCTVRGMPGDMQILSEALTGSGRSSLADDEIIQAEITFVEGRWYVTTIHPADSNAKADKSRD